MSTEARRFAPKIRMSACPTSKASELLSNEPYGAECPFVFSSAAETLIACGERTLLRLPLMDMPAAVRHAFAADQGMASRRLFVGALPFSSVADGLMFEPSEVRRKPGMIDAVQCSTAGRSQITPQPSRDVYKHMVARALNSMRDLGKLRKVVLARALSVESDSEIDIPCLLGRLAHDREATVYAVPLRDDQKTTLVGATPELLLSKSGRKVVSSPLAGSAARSANPDEDRKRAEALLHSDKDLREHASVVESVVEQLAPFCTRISVPNQPAVSSTATMWHLGTRIEGDLKDDSVSSLDLAVALHPTAAVCGLPRKAAAGLIHELEPFDRGFFAGAVGWCDSNGNGQWMVTIRCAEIAGNKARLLAGAGIIPGSDPEMEAAETGAKFETLLRALGIAETDRPTENR